MNYAIHHRTDLHPSTTSRMDTLLRSLPTVLDWAERIGLYIFLSALWGVLIYLALTAA